MHVFPKAKVIFLSKYVPELVTMKTLIEDPNTGYIPYLYFVLYN
jgi:hypothetical protein